MKIKELILIVIMFFVNSVLIAEEIKLKPNNNEYNVYTGMFDFSDDGKRATLIGFQHQNEELNRNTFLGNLSPITGAMITADNATYFYTGVQANYKIIPHETAIKTREFIANDIAAWASYQPAFDKIVKMQPDLLD